MTDSVTIRTPDDFHVHLRENKMTAAVAHFTASSFGRALTMPNLTPPITNRKMARLYKSRVEKATKGFDFEPLMTLYLTDGIKADEVVGAFQSGEALAAKLYPVGATTNSAAGVTDISKIRHVLEKMQEMGMTLCVHGEALLRNGDEVLSCDREAVFIEDVLTPLLRDFPELKVVLEHVSTALGVAFVSGANEYVGATITAHHLLITENDIYRGGMHPHLYCLPIAKRDEDRIALRKAAVSGNPKFFLGTDSAPHHLYKKHSSCCPGGVFTAPSALELYAQVFDEEDALDQLEAFASVNGANFYGLPLNEGTITLIRKSREVPQLVMFNEPNGELITVKPFVPRIPDVPNEYKEVSSLPWSIERH